jgi:hypothetical protein
MLRPGEYDDSPQEAAPTLDVGRYSARLGMLLVALGVLWFCVIPYYSELTRFVWLVPLFAYSAAAIWRLLYVPCVWTEDFRYRDVDQAATIALWNVGSERVRYGLMFFEELVLLAIVVGFYGLAFIVVRCWRSGPPKIRS